MTPDEILDNLKLMNAKISRKTLYNWEKAGVIPVATFRNSRTAEYPPVTFAQTYAAYIFTQEGLAVPIFNFKVKVVLDAVVNIRIMYSAFAEIAEENNLLPWDNETDFNKVVLSLLQGKVENLPKTQLEMSFYHDMFYWPRQYHIQILKATDFLKTRV